MIRTGSGMRQTNFTLKRHLHRNTLEATRACRACRSQAIRRRPNKRVRRGGVGFAYKVNALAHDLIREYQPDPSTVDIDDLLAQAIKRFDEAAVVVAPFCIE